MINQLLLIISLIIIYEFLKYFKFIEILTINLKSYQKIKKIFISKKISDFKKEKLIISFSRLLFMTSVKIISIIISILIFIHALNLLSNSFLSLIFSIMGIVELFIIFTIYHLLRNK